MNSLFSISTGASCELTYARSNALERFHFSPLTEAEFVILVSCKKGLKGLAGRRRTIGETLIE